jgi:hypothetical protein
MTVNLSGKETKIVSQTVDILALQGEVSTGILPPGNYTGTATITYQGVSPLVSNEIALSFSV